MGKFDFNVQLVKYLNYLKSNIEAYHRYEYLIIHRLLLWSIRAVIFYLGKDGRYTLNNINSGYRYRFHEEYFKKPNGSDISTVQ